MGVINNAMETGFQRDPVDAEKGDLVIQMLRHLRETRTSLWRASRHLGVPRREFRRLLAFDWDHVSVADMRSMANSVRQLPHRRFALVSRRLEHWRTPPELDARRDEATREALRRYFESHPEEPGNEAALRFLKSM